jgi:hypothetical protein
MGGQYPSSEELRNRTYSILNSMNTAQQELLSGSLGQYRQPIEDDEESDDDYPGQSANPNAPAILTDVPTSSINPSRPRTVAAGYDKDRRVMTVMFRDGVLWNYYDVSPDEWIKFHSSISKGKPWLNLTGPGTPGEFTKKQHGPADASGVSSQVLSEIYVLARAAQVRYQYRSGVKKGTARQGSELKKPRANGRNQATAGKAPRRKK